MRLIELLLPFNTLSLAFSFAPLPSCQHKDVIRNLRRMSEDANTLEPAGEDPTLEDQNPDDQPSDVNPQENAEMRTLEENLSFIQTLGAITGRGEFATKTQKQAATNVVSALEGYREVEIPPESLHGTWDLVYCSTQLFRSSPFFMAGRAVCTTEDQARQYNWFCDMHRQALSISDIGAVRQIVAPERIVSEFETKVGAIPFLNDFTPFSYSGGLPAAIEGAIVSSADWELRDSKTMMFLMDTVEIKGSNIPGLRQILDDDRIKLQSRQLGSFLETNLDSYSNPRPRFTTTYLDKKIRINRDQDDNIFVYCKTSDSTEPTDYSNKDSDLGIGRLLEGFNDAITKIYL